MCKRSKQSSLFSSALWWQIEIIRLKLSFKVTSHVFSHLFFISFFKKWSKPGLFFVYFWAFQTNNTIFLQFLNKTIDARMPEWNMTTGI